MNTSYVDFLLTIYQEQSESDLALLRDTIKSMCAQTHPYIEYWVAYDETTPETTMKFVSDEFVKNMSTTPGSHHRISWWKQHPTDPSRKLMANMDVINDFIECRVSSSPYIAITHSDDQSFPTRIEDQVASFEKCPNAVLSLAGFEFWENNKKQYSSFFQRISRGLNVGYPSAWMIQRERWVSYYVNIPMKFDVDMIIQQWTCSPIIIMTKPLIRYNMIRTLSNYTKVEDQRTWELIEAKYRDSLPDLNEIQYVVPSMTLMVCGWFADGYEMPYYCDELERMGVKVIRISLDEINTPNITPVQEQISQYIQRDPKQQDYLSFRVLYPIAPILAKYQYDAIFIQQNNLAIDWADVVGKKYLLLHEIVTRHWLYSSKGIVDVDGIFYAYLGAPQYYQNEHTYEMQRIKQSHFDYLPYAWSPDQYPPVNRIKKHFLGFMGSIGEDHSKEENEDADYTQWHLRDLRARFVAYCQKFHGCIVPNRQQDYHKYYEFMIRCDLFLNVSANSGFVNQRQFHAPACGCVLLQNRYHGLGELGLKDFENCLLFSDEKELDYKIQWAHQNPDELNQIRKNGMVWARQHTYRQRAEDLITHIQRWVTE